MNSYYKVWVKVSVERVETKGEQTNWREVWESEPVDVYSGEKVQALSAAQTLTNFCEQFASVPMKQIAQALKPVKRKYTRRKKVKRGPGRPKKS